MKRVEYLEELLPGMIPGVEYSQGIFDAYEYLEAVGRTPYIERGGKRIRVHIDDRYYNYSPPYMG